MILMVLSDAALWSVSDIQAGAFDTFDPGRSDPRNDGLAGFKRHLEANAVALPYAFYPDERAHVNAENLSARAVGGGIWPPFALPVARIVVGVLYGYLT